MSSPGDFPWNEIVEGSELEQGDLLRNCPVILPVPDLRFPLDGDDRPGEIYTFDVVVMTQSCDLVNDKVTDVILCPHWDLVRIPEFDVSLASKSAQQAVIKGHRPRYTMMAASHLPEMPMGVRIIDCGRIWSLPKPFVQQFAAYQGPRLRLRPPYREHLSQAFARFFMRVGLPQDIELSK